ncbi:MAG: TnpV protein [Clostridiales Family XIII bacterium]|jgi:hypothetical protein|nr:TnpV protein [Clostridiales Family XIII bacterium]
MESNRQSITYHKEGDYYYPDLYLPEQKEYEYGKYGRMRLKHLKEHRRPLYLSLVANLKLGEHLEEIDQTAYERVHRIAKEIARRNGCHENLKNTDPLKWVGLMNNAIHCAEESVLAELIYD